MIGSIERGWRRISRHSLVPVVVLVGLHGPIDPTRRTTGYGGILPVPAPTTSATASTATGMRSESLLDQQRRELRAARGRVLYADGHTAPEASVRPEHKVSCPERRIVQRGRANSSPTS